MSSSFLYKNAKINILRSVKTLKTCLPVKNRDVTEILQSIV